jgi:HrpA-like RNA helicase
MSGQIRADGIMDPDGKYPNPLTGQPYTKQYFYHSIRTNAKGELDGWKKFKPWQDRMEIFRKIHKYNILLTIIPPGTGKTVILPKLLLHYFGYQRPVVCTTPRQATTSSAGTFAAKCLDVPIFHVDEKGDELVNPDIKNKKENPYYETGYRVVGYKYSGKNYSNPNTLLLFTTDGTVKQMILQGTDPNLSKYGGVIIDEAHERSVNIDIIIALLLDIVHRRPDFKVIIMSATIDKTFFTDYFKRVGLGNAYSVYEVPELKPLFERKEVKEFKKIDPSKFVDVIYNKVNEIILNPSLPIGDILAFVTSESETVKLKNKIDKNIKNYSANNKPYSIAFSAQISDNDKSVALKKGALLTDVKPTADAPQGFSRKVIIGTNAVESSVTFGDPLKYVIESGLAYEKKYDAKNYCYTTGKFYVSQASIAQRCGRTGRTCDGTCLQLYTTPQFNEFQKFTDPKIIVEDFTKELLGIVSLPMNGNLQKALEFINRMIEPPKNYQIAISRAYNNLINMDLLDSAGNITPLGRVCNSFNKFDIKITKMCVGGYYLGCLQYTIALGAILSQVMSIEDMFQKPFGYDDDPKLQREYENNIIRQKNDFGDHITLLSIFVNWSSSPDPHQYATQNGINQFTLRNIQNAYKDLEKEVLKLAVDIKNLNLFNVPPEILAFGGSRIDDNIDTSDIGDIGDIGDIDETDSDSVSSDVEMEDLEDISIPNESELNAMYGGYFETKNNFGKQIIGDSRIDSTDSRMSNNFKTKLTAEDIEEFNRSINKPRHQTYNGSDNQAIFQDNNSSSESLYNSSTNGGGNGINDANTNRKKTKKATNNPRTNTKARKSQSNRYKGYKGVGGAPEKGKEKEKNNEAEIRAKRNAKIIELISLKGLTPKIMYPPPEPVDKILCALFYGFSNNLASFTGVGKKYNVKFSPLKASISKSIFDYNGRTPDFVLYHEFTVTKTQGRPDEEKLNIVSEIRANEFGQFIDLNEIKKQL